jgi:hypothetical protein
MLKAVLLAGAGIASIATVTVAAAEPAPRPMFAVEPIKRAGNHRATSLPTWVFSWTYNGTKYNATFVGTNPSGGASTTVPVELIPVILKWETTKENPNTKWASAKASPTALTAASPIFDATTDYTQGGTDLGATQYEDAFQRAALWGTVSSNTGYHVLLGKPTIEKPLKLTVPKASGKLGSPFGTQVLEVDINWFDNAIQSTIAKYPADSLPIFITSNTYLTSGGGCCIGGYHSYTGTQAYSHFTFIKATGTFAEDVAALSHEVGEWLDDPLIDNSVACGIYEVGDPLEGGQSGHPYGTWAYPLNGFTYHLQDLVLPPYFGAPTSTSVNGWLTFQGYSGLKVCSNGG